MKKKSMIIWIGFTDGKPHFYSDPQYYHGVFHGDIFRSEKAAKKCFQDARKFTIRFP